MTNQQNDCHLNNKRESNPTMIRFCAPKESWMTALFTASAAVRLHDEKFKLTEKRSEHRDTSEAVFQWNDEEARYYQ